MSLFYFDKNYENKMVKRFTLVGRILLLVGLVWLGYSIILLANPEMEIRFNGELTRSINAKLLMFAGGVFYVLFASAFAFLPRLLIGTVKKRLGVNNDPTTDNSERSGIQSNNPEDPDTGITRASLERESSLVKKFWLMVALPLIILWSLLLILVPKYHLFDVNILKYILQSVMFSGLVLFGLSIIVTFIRVLYAIVMYFRGQGSLNRNILFLSVRGMHPIQTFALHVWLFVVAFIATGILTSYIGKLLQ